MHGGDRKAGGFPGKAPKQGPGRWILCWTAAMPAGEWILQLCFSFLVAPRRPQGQSHCGRLPQHSRVSCSAAGCADVHCQDSHEPNTTFCKLIWLYLVQTEFQPPAVISQQRVGTPPGLPPQGTGSPRELLPGNLSPPSQLAGSNGSAGGNKKSLHSPVGA